MLKLVNHQSRLWLQHPKFLKVPDDSNFAYRFEHYCFRSFFFFLRISGPFESPVSLFHEFSGVFLCYYGSYGNSCLLFPGGVARFAIALRGVKFSEPLINGPKPTSLQPQLLVNWQAKMLSQGQEKDESVEPTETG